MEDRFVHRNTYRWFIGISPKEYFTRPACQRIIIETDRPSTTYNTRPIVYTFLSLSSPLLFRMWTDFCRFSTWPVLFIILQKKIRVNQMIISEKRDFANWSLLVFCLSLQSVGLVFCSTCACETKAYLEHRRKLLGNNGIDHIPA